ncbi:MAG: trypsin-like peptidase domain-containing protein [Candidatus Obscuribacterales bacterium]
MEKLHRGEMGFHPDDTFCDLDALNKVAKAVCRVVTPKGLGTAFVIAPNLIMTNHHVIDSPATAQKSQAEFFYDTDTAPHSAHPRITVSLDPDRLFVTSPAPVDEEDVGPSALDYTIVAIHSDEALTSIFRSAISLFEGRDLVPCLATIVQHPEGLGKKISIGNHKITHTDDWTLLYKTTTLPGSSGSPVLTPSENRLKLVALHHGSTLIKGNNIGIRISAILRDLEEKKCLNRLRFWPYLTGETPVELYRGGLAFYKEERYAEAVELFRAADPFPAAQNTLGVCYERGHGVSQDFTEAAAWYQKGAYSGSGCAAYNLALAYYNGRGVPHDPHRALHWLRQGEATDTDAAKLRPLLEDFLLGLQQLERGEGEKGLGPLIRSANGGFADAYWALGVHYEKQKALKKAFQSYSEGYRLGSARACYNLAICYLHGKGTHVDQRRAVQLLNQAADLGHEGAIQHLQDRDTVPNKGRRIK